MKRTWKRSRGRVVAGLSRARPHRRRHDERRVGRRPLHPTAAPPARPAGRRTNELGATLNDGDFGETYTPDAGPAPTGARRCRVVAVGGAGSQHRPGHDQPGRRSPVDYDLAMKCWENNGCDTGTGGDLKVGLADGFGGNIARQIVQDGVHPAGAHVPGDRRDRLHRRQPRHAEGDLRRAQLRRPGLRRHPQLPRRRRGARARPTGRPPSRAPRSSPGRTARSASPAPTTSRTAAATSAPSPTPGATKFGEELPDGGQIAHDPRRAGQPDSTRSTTDCLLETLPDNIELVAKQGTAWSREALPRGDVGDPRPVPRHRRHRRQLRRRLRRRDAGVRRRRHLDGRPRHDAPVGRQPVPVRLEGRRWRDELVHLRRPAGGGPDRDDGGDDEDRRLRRARRRSSSAPR